MMSWKTTRNHNTNNYLSDPQQRFHNTCNSVDKYKCSVLINFLNLDTWYFLYDPKTCLPDKNTNTRHEKLTFDCWPELFKIPVKHTEHCCCIWLFSRARRQFPTAKDFWILQKLLRSPWVGTDHNDPIPKDYISWYKRKCHANF